MENKEFHILDISEIIEIERQIGREVLEEMGRLFDELLAKEKENDSTSQP